MASPLLLSPDQLPYFITEQVYLIKENNQSALSDQSANASLPFSKPFVIFLDLKNYSINNAQSALLEKILQAVGLSLLDVGLADIKDFEVAKLIENKVNNCLVFTDGNKNIEKYILIKNQGLTYLAADGLGLIENDVNLKKQLWAPLKQMFIS